LSKFQETHKYRQTAGLDRNTQRYDEMSASRGVHIATSVLTCLLIGRIADTVVSQCAGLSISLTMSVAPVLIGCAVLMSFVQPQDLMAVRSACIIPVVIAISRPLGLGGFLVRISKENLMHSGVWTPSASVICAGLSFLLGTAFGH